MVTSATPEERPDGFSIADAWWGAAMIGPTGVILDVNAAFAEVFARQPGDLIGRSLDELLGEDAISNEREIATRLIDGGGPVIEYQRRIERPGLDPWDGVVRVSLLRDKDGQPEVFHVRLSEPGPRRPPDRIAWREGAFPLALDSMRVGVAIIGLDGKLIQANRALCEIIGRTEAELGEIDLLEMTHPGDRVLDVELGTRAWRGEIDTYAFEKRVVRPDGSFVWVHQEITFARDETGKPVHLVGQVIDITDRKAVESELARSQAELTDLVDQVPIGLLSSGPDGLIITANSAAAEIAGLTEIPPGTDITPMIHPDDLERIAKISMDNARSGQDYRIEFRLIRPDGTIRWVRNDARANMGADGSLMRIRGTWQDVTELKAAEDLLQRQATLDALTGLSNRHVLFAALAGCIERSASGLGRLSVLFVDLDGFKAVNDSYGHGVGDLVLIQAAQRIKSAAAHAAVVARIGGDEFIVAVEQSPSADREHVEDLAGAIIASIRHPFDVRSTVVELGASVGIATWAPAMTADDLVSAADRAVYLAKDAGRNCWRYA